MKDVIKRKPGSLDTDEMEVVIVRIADGMRCRYVPNYKKHYTWEDEFWWTDGNAGCDCNRTIFWNWVHDLPTEEADCNYANDRRFAVILRSPGVE